MGFYIGLFMQIWGFAAVGLCVISGIEKGDYGRIELVQFLGGTSLFYLGNFLRSKGASSN